VPAQIGRFETHLGIARTVRLTEAIAREAHNHGPDRIDHPTFQTTGHGSLIELPLIVSQLSCLMFLAQDLSELVPVFDGESTQGHRHFHDIFLIHHDAVRLREDLIEQRMKRPDIAAHELDARIHQRTHSQRGG
jgi:hypothetical protein